MTDTQWLLDLVEEATPGPWRQGESRGDTHEVIAITSSQIRPAGEARVTLRSEYVAETAISADARLMALAPDLARLCVEQYEALHRIADARSAYGIAEQGGAREIARAALARFAELKP